MSALDDAYARAEAMDCVIECATLNDALMWEVVVRSNDGIEARAWMDGDDPSEAIEHALDRVEGLRRGRADRLLNRLLDREEP